MPRKLSTRACAFAIVLFCAVLGVISETRGTDPADRKVLWREPRDIQRRNLLLGPGGAEMKPDLRRVTLIKEETSGTSKKYRVVDASGREWVAKVGKEAQAETAASRLLWASGYYADTDYLVPSVRIEGLNKTLTNVRFGARPKDEKRNGGWKWKTNPFVGRREYQGLKVLMALLNNWDTKDSNNRIVMAKNADGQNEARYVVHDLGASFGKKMNWFERNLLFKRDRNNTNGYARARLINKVRGDSVELNYWSKNRKTLRKVSVEDARWMGKVLSRLSQQQIADAFRAANYTPAQVRLMTQAVRARIAELNDLPGSSQVARH